MRMYRWRATIGAENPKRLLRLKKNIKNSKKRHRTDTVYTMEKSWVNLGCVIDKEWFDNRDKLRREP